MKISLKILSVLFTFLTSFAISQVTFENTIEPPYEDFIGTNSSIVQFFDFDSDGDEDLFLCGNVLQGEPSSVLYLNDGFGGFTPNPVSNPAISIYAGGIAAYDFDNDNDKDLILNGYSAVGHFVLLRNDFNTITSNLSLHSYSSGVGTGDLEILDANDDGHMDLVETGFEGSSSLAIYSLLRLNDGTGEFTVQTSGFVGVTYSSLDVGDVDNDGDVDVLISGRDVNNLARTILYLNNGLGTFSQSNSSFLGLYQGTTELEDIDNDLDLDIVATGIDTGYNIAIKVYKNNGSGTFFEVSNFGIAPLSYSDIAFSDLDADGDVDMVMNGFDGVQPRTIVYENSGNGDFIPNGQSNLIQLQSGAVAFSDIDLDGDDDLFVTGVDSNSWRQSELYLNDGNGNFSWVIGNPFTITTTSSAQAVDIDGDTDVDILYHGYNQTYLEHNSFVYRNNGNGSFLPDTTSLGNYLYQSHMECGDIDNDGDQDMMIMGQPISSTVGEAKVFKNNGLGEFTLTNNTIVQLVQGSFDFSDVDMDLDLDFVIQGQDLFGNAHTALYKNDGTGLFIMDSTVVFIPVKYGDIDFADVDGDLDEDLLMIGMTIENTFSFDTTVLYVNDGTGGFSLSTTAVLTNQDNGRCLFADVDGDLDQDILISGSGPIDVFMNNGSGVFTLHPPITDFTGQFVYNFSCTDVDLDGDLDIYYTAHTNFNLFNKILINQGGGVYIEESIPDVKATWGTNILFFDMDGDSDQDLFVNGSEGNNKFRVDLYRNVPCSSFSDTITISECGSYQLSSGEEVTSSGTYYDTLEVGINCTAALTILLTIDQVDTSVTVANGVISANLTNANYQWYNCDFLEPLIGETAISYTPTAPGNYSVMINNGTCSQMSGCYHVGVADLRDFDPLMNVELVPNPATTSIQIVGLADVFSVENRLEITNLQGEVLSTGFLSSEMDKMDVSNLAAGTYFLRYQQKFGLYKSFRFTKL